MYPQLAFVISLIYITRADGKITNEEVGNLLLALGGRAKDGIIEVGENNRALLEKAKHYASTIPLVTEGQKFCLLTSLIDCALADGDLASEEQQVISQFIQAFGLTETRLQTIFEVLVLKNDRSVLINPDHPRNHPAYRVTL
jgi:uncharacterized tellurite resistance protein B-like protein